MMDRPFESNNASNSVLGMELIMNPRKRSPSDVASTTSSAALSRSSFRGIKDTTVRVVDPRTASSMSSRGQSEGRGGGSLGGSEAGDSSVSDASDAYEESSNGSESSTSSASQSRSRGHGRSSKGKRHGHTHGRGGSEHEHEREDRRSSEADELDAKQQLLHQFQRLEKRGVTLPRRFTLASSLSEMQTEFDNLRKDRLTDVSVAWQRKMLMVCVSGIEMLNNQFNPFDVKLRGWSDTVHDSVDEYDDIFEELSDKYGGKSTMAPELRLMFGIGGSAVMFHMTQSLCKTMPGLEHVLKDNPALMQQISQAMMSSMKGHPPQAQAPPAGNGMFSFLGNMFANAPKGPPSASPAPAPPPQPSNPMRGPSQVDDLLRDLHATAFADPPQRPEVQRNSGSRMEVLSNASDSDYSDMPEEATASFLPPPSSARVLPQAAAPPAKPVRARARRTTTVSLPI